jgi:hypothetical protein
MQVLLVQKNGALKQTVMTGEPHKKCGFKSANGFDLQAKWGNISLYGKKDGKAGSENKYEFPPPVDSLLLFGACLLKKDGENLDLKEWEAKYKELFGGFDDVKDEETDESEDEAEEGVTYTREGYEVDDFVVADELEEEEYS